MKSLGYLYIYGDKSVSSNEKLNKDKLRKQFGTGIGITEQITLVRRRFKSHKTVGQHGKKNRKKQKQYFEKNISPQYHKKGRAIWL